MADHGHAHQEVPSDLTLRVKALESLLVEKGLVDPAALSDVEPDTTLVVYETKEGILNFSTPENLTVEEETLRTDIVILDHRSNHQLGAKSREREQVRRLLYNAIVLLQYHDATQGRAVLEEAKKVYYHHNQTKNRIRYLVGAMAGVITAGILGFGLLHLPKYSGPFITPPLLVLILVFAGMGSVTSILTRISSIDLAEETSNFSVFISGFARAPIAIFFAVIVYLILDMKIIDIKFGTPSDANQGGIYAVTSFLSGFSERFAQDIISRVPFGGSETTGSH
jgi:hypothetical protein